MRMIRRPAIALAFTLCLAVSGCGVLGFSAGDKAREEVLVPRVAASWALVAEEIERGVEDSPVLTETEKAEARSALVEWSVEMATDQRDRTDLIALRDRDWPEFFVLANQGVEHRYVAGEIGPQGRTIARENVEWFDAALWALDGEPTDLE